MPELPEVETIVLQLKSKIKGRALSQCDIRTRSVIKDSPARFKRIVEHQGILEVVRKGKYIGLVMDHGRVLWIHLGMTGQLLWLDHPEADIHQHVFFYFTGQPGTLCFRDIRKFGRLFISPPEAESLVRLAPDPFEMSGEEFIRRFKSRSGLIKSLLMHQQVISGLGNIYAAESLFRAGIYPKKRSCRVSVQTLKRLHGAVQAVLREAIEWGGSSIDDYRHMDGSRGRFQERHQVYGREDRPCDICGTLIRKVRTAGRSSFFCPQCQK